MKITKSQLKQLIKEELGSVLEFESSAGGEEGSDELVPSQELIDIQVAWMSKMIKQVIDTAGWDGVDKLRMAIGKVADEVLDHE